MTMRQILYSSKFFSNPFQKCDKFSASSGHNLQLKATNQPKWSESVHWIISKYNSGLSVLWLQASWIQVLITI
jgi:hypothetical protein